MSTDDEAKRAVLRISDYVAQIDAEDEAHFDQDAAGHRLPRSDTIHHGALR